MNSGNGGMVILWTIRRTGYLAIPLIVPGLSGWNQKQTRRTSRSPGELYDLSILNTPGHVSWGNNSQ
jgi:hypothetical protein